MKYHGFALFAALLSFLWAADVSATAFPDGNIRKNDGFWNNINVYHMMHTANPFGASYDNTYLEVEGGARSGVLDLYYFFDVNEIFGWGSDKKEAGQFFTKIKPRISIDALTGRDLALGPVKEWYIATQYKGFNDGEYYAAGVGTDLAVPGVDLLQLCFWPTFVRFSGSSNTSYAGFEFSVNWYKKVWQMPGGIVFSYQGWMDYGFSNEYARTSGVPNSTPDQFQMFNGFFFTKDRYSVSFDVKFHHNFGYINQYHSDDTSYFAGLHYKL